MQPMVVAFGLVCAVIPHVHPRGGERKLLLSTEYVFRRKIPSRRTLVEQQFGILRLRKEGFHA